MDRSNGRTAVKATAALCGTVAALGLSAAPAVAADKTAVSLKVQGTGKADPQFASTTYAMVFHQRLAFTCPAGETALISAGAGATYTLGPYGQYSFRAASGSVQVDCTGRQQHVSLRLSPSTRPTAVEVGTPVPFDATITTSGGATAKVDQTVKIVLPD